MVDQTPIGRTTRSNPASYVGAFDAIRKLFAAAAARDASAATPRAPSASTPATAAARPAAATASSTSRCSSSPTCTCAARTATASASAPEVLEVKWAAAQSIADVLELTVAEARRSSSRGEPDVVARLQPLVDVGLEYLRLGQPVPTLSGGEAQRLKLAGHLAAAATQVRGAKGSLFLFDEPTTGLHFDDIAKLLRRLPPPARRRPLAGRDRAQPRRDPRLRLDHRPRARRAAMPAARSCAPARRARSWRTTRSHTGAALRGVRGGARPPARARAAGARTGARQPAPGGPAPARPQRDHDPQRPRAQPQEHRRRHPARPLHRDHRRVRPRQDRRSRSTSCSPRASGATSNRSTPTRASSCSRRRARTSTRSSAFRRRSRSSSARAAADARARSRR